VLFDWFTVGAQALNFLILVWLLKRLLYKPILAAIDTREQRIARNWRMPRTGRRKRTSSATSSCERLKNSTGSVPHS